MPLRSAGLTLKASPALKCGHRTGGNPLLAGLTLKETKFRLALLGGRSSPDGGAPSGQAPLTRRGSPLRGFNLFCLRPGGSRRCAALHPRLIRGRPFGARDAPPGLSFRLASLGGIRSRR